MTREEMAAARAALHAELEALNEEGRALDEAIRRMTFDVTPSPEIAELLNKLRMHSERLTAHQHRVAILAELEKAHRVGSGR